VIRYILATARLSSAEYQELADLRHQIRRFLHFSEGAALAVGLEPRQHQALLAIKARPGDQRYSVSALAKSLFLRHQSTVGLVDRMEARKLIRRSPDAHDGRQVILSLTRHGEETLRRLSLTHRAELEQSAPDLAKALRAVIRRSKNTAK
jgi:DNA-binding MarR family transcriptional regulator